MDKIIVILEDEETIMNSLQLLCKKYNFTSECFYYVDELINHIDVLNRATMFITDFNLKDSTVIPLLDKIREKRINVYTVLNSGNPKALEQIEEAGLSDLIDGFLDKTMDFKQFFNKFV